MFAIVVHNKIEVRVNSLLINVLTLLIKFTSFPFTLAASLLPPNEGSVGVLPQPTACNQQFPYDRTLWLDHQVPRTARKESIFGKYGDCID